MTFTFANLSRYTFLNLHEGKIYTHVPVLLVEKLKITISLLCPRGSIYLTRCNQNMKKKKKKKKGSWINWTIIRTYDELFRNFSAHGFLQSIFKAGTVNNSVNENFILSQQHMPPDENRKPKIGGGYVTKCFVNEINLTTT